MKLQKKDFKIFFSEKRFVYEIMAKNTVQLDIGNVMIEYGACILHAGGIRLERHTQNMYSLATSTLVTQPHHNITIIGKLPVLLCVCVGTLYY
jgi:hypothetical protein